MLIPSPGVMVQAGGMTVESILEVRVPRHVFVSDRPFSDVIDGVYRGVSKDDVWSSEGASPCP